MCRLTGNESENKDFFWTQNNWTKWMWKNHQINESENNNTVNWNVWKYCSMKEGAFGIEIQGRVELISPGFSP